VKSSTWIPLAIALSLAASPAPSRAADPARVAAARRALDRGIYLKGPETLVQARAQFEALSKAEPGSARLHYWVALADWRLVPRFQDAKQAERFCKDGLEHADQALKLDPKLAEALALKSALQALSLRFDPGSTMTVGLELETNMRRALEMAPDNPRILLLDGINTLHKPTFVGGGADKAFAKLSKASQLFAAESASDSTAPVWGRQDAFIWAGRSAMTLKNYGAAREFYDRALELNPANGWVRYTLVPELDKASAADSTGKNKP
jgi:tetratricopeptide (TPR) repeat protein